MNPRSIKLLLLCLVAFQGIAFSQTLNVPPRPTNAPSGSQFAKMITTLSLAERENAICAQVLQGNVPNWMRSLVLVTTNATINSVNHTVSYYVTPDYLAVGNDTDYFLMPMTPLLGQRIADTLGCSLPTRKMVNDIWKKAPCKLAPSTIPPSSAMTTVPVFEQHNTTVRGQRFAVTNTYPLGTLTGGDKKDVVIATKIYTGLQPGVPKPVVIYGWHQLSGSPIQPLYNGHEESYADYSHGIRLVQMALTVNGQPDTVTNVLKNASLAALLSDETTYSGNTLPTPRYTLPAYAPAITTQPYSQAVNPGTDVTFSAYAIGDAPLHYQWQFNGNNIAGATSATLTLSGAQSGNAGSYTVVVTNSAGSATSLAAVLAIHASSYSLLFSDTFETNSASLWNFFQDSGNGTPDYTADWSFDYGAVGYVWNGKGFQIPPAPNSGGTTRGVKLTVNNNDATAATAAVNLYPKNLSASGNFALKFDLWMNYPGGPGGINSTGSTEHAICGINHAGTRPNWAAASASATDGLWFGVDGEGGTSRDYRAYVGNLSGVQTELIGAAASGLAQSNNTAGIFPALFPASRFESEGAPGKRWVSGEINQVNNTITWKLDGTVVAQRVNTSSFTSGTVMIGYMDVFTSIANPTNDAFVIFDNVRVENWNVSPTLPPEITTQPQSQTVSVGEAALFSVVASGTAPFNYQWRFNGANISGATGSSHAIASAQLSDAGNYSVLVSNSAGSVASAQASLTVTASGNPPAITQQPNGQMVNQGTEVTFTVVATGTGPLSYQWRFYGGNISGATASSHTISSAQPGDAGTYSVVVTNNWGSETSSGAVLIVNTPPTITTQPQSQTVAPGANATFTVASSGTAPIYYQWRLNGVDISGATDTSYTRGNVQSADTGIYSVVVYNSVGSTLSDDASLWLAGHSVFGDEFESGSMSNWTVLSGNTALTISTAQNQTPGGSKSALVTSSLNKMYRNLGAEVQNRAKVTFWIYDDNGAQHRVYGEVRSYTGAGYPGTLQQLFAIGRYGTGFGTGTGTLAGEVVNTAKYQGRIVAGSNTGWFNLNANRTVGWHKFEIERAADGTTMNFYVDGALDRTITSATYATWDSVTIGSVGASGTTGNAWFDDVNAEYTSSPVITTHPSSQSVSAGANVTFSVAATGNVAGYQWRKNGVFISGATGSSLTLTNVQAEDAGTYTCVVSNGVGPTSSNAATLTVN